MVELSALEKQQSTKTAENKVVPLIKYQILESYIFPNTH